MLLCCCSNFHREWNHWPVAQLPTAIYYQIYHVLGPSEVWITCSEIRQLDFQIYGSSRMALSINWVNHQNWTRARPYCSEIWYSPFFFLVAALEASAENNGRSRKGGLQKTIAGGPEVGA